MRAVNLIPSDQRRGAGGAAGRSGGGVYIFLGALALLVVMAGAFVVSGKSVNDKKAQLASLEQQAQQAEQRTQALSSYTKFASVRAKREQTIQQLAAGRVDWAHSLREVARVLPTNAWLTQLTGTSTPAVQVAGGSSTGLRGALAVPALSIQGCTTSQASVAKMMARMRLIDGVQRVSLEKSEKNDTSGAGGGGGSASATDCRGASRHFPQFSIVVFLDPPAGAATAPGATGATQTAAASSATPASSTTPSSTTTAATGGTTP
jgi:Tfp pilus assembly protein PilN